MDGIRDQDSAAQHPSLSRVVPRLLRGVLYRDDDGRAWQELVDVQAAVRDYVSIMGLELRLDEAEGYAFLQSRSEAPDATDSPPRLVARRQLSFPVSLLLALLRKKLAEFDAGGNDSKLVVTTGDAAEMMRVFMPAGSNEARFVDNIGAHLNKASELGFVRKIRGGRPGGEQAYEVRRILQAFINAQWLTEFNERLAEYRHHLGGNGGPDDE